MSPRWGTDQKSRGAQVLPPRPQAHRRPSFGKSMGTIYQSATHGAHVTHVLLVTCRQGKPHTSIPQAGNEARRGESELAPVPSEPLASRSPLVAQVGFKAGLYWLLRLPLLPPSSSSLPSASLLCSLSLFLFHKHPLGISCVPGSVRGAEDKAVRGGPGPCPRGHRVSRAAL